MCHPSLKLRGVFATFVLLISALFSEGCHHEAPGTNSVDWGTLVQFPVSDGLSVDKLQQQVGFKLVLPSYLPQEMRVYHASGAQTASTFPWASKENSWEASISISPLPSGGDELNIQIAERQRQADDLPLDPAYIDDATTTIGQTTVTCHLEPQELLMTPPPTPEQLIMPDSEGTPTSIFLSPESALYPNYLCFWETDNLRLTVHFIWSLSEPLPGLITFDMREEAMKVVASMIEDPYIP